MNRLFLSRQFFSRGPAGTVHTGPAGRPARFLAARLFSAGLVPGLLAPALAALAFLALPGAGSGPGVSVARAAEAPAALPRSPFLEDLSWLELRSAMAGGVDTAIVPVGGVEARGPHLALDAANRLTRSVVEAAARADGKTVIAPLIPFVPEMNDEGEGNLQWPGTIHVSADTLAGMVAEVAASLKVHGIHRIVLLGGSESAAETLRDSATGLSELWKDEDVRVIFADSVFAPELAQAVLARHGFTAAQAGGRAGLAETAEMLACCADGVRQAAIPRTPQAVAASGASGQPELATAALGQELLAVRVNALKRALVEVRTAAPASK